MTPLWGDVQGRVDALIRDLATGLAPAEETYLLAVLANRAASELHRVARAEASARKGADDWGNWAALQNAARTLVLQSSTCRDYAARVSSRPR